MKKQSLIDFNRIKDAIEFLDQNYKEQPNLEAVASHVNLSAAHFQRIFTDWAGVSPKQFLQHTTAIHAKTLLRNEKDSLFSFSHDLGLSSTSRLHDLFIKIEAMTPGEYKNGGEGLEISYQIADTLFGKVLIASTSKGICSLTFIDSKEEGFSFLNAEYPKANLFEKDEIIHQKALAVLFNQAPAFDEMKLHIRGTEFQIKVWEALLKIPQGRLASYGDLAKAIGKPKASRAVGTAIGRNPIAYLIPCHRVIQATGAFGGYRWDTARKKAMIGWESIQENKK